MVSAMSCKMVLKFGTYRY